VIRSTERCPFQPRETLQFGVVTAGSGRRSSDLLREHDQLADVVSDIVMTHREVAACVAHRRVPGGQLLGAASMLVLVSPQP
jgi:hypothetical protein